MARPMKIVEGEQPQAVEIMEKAIVEIADAARRLLDSRLKKKTVLVLLAHETKLAQWQIEAVLDNAAQLDKLYLK